MPCRTKKAKSTAAIACTGNAVKRNGATAQGRTTGFCNCWDVVIPRSLTKEHRFCLDFTPSKYFGEDNGAGHPEFETRFAEEIARHRLTKYMDLKPGMEIWLLYHTALRSYQLHPTSQAMLESRWQRSHLKTNRCQRAGSNHSSPHPGQRRLFSCRTLRPRSRCI